MQLEIFFKSRVYCTQIPVIQEVCVPGGVPLAVVIGKEGFIANAVDAAAPPTAPIVGAFSIRKLRISSKASFIISSIISGISGIYKKNTVWSLLGLILASDIFSRDISIPTYHHRIILAWGLFGSVDVPVQDILSSAWRLFGTRIFLHRDTSAWGYYATGKFWHHAKQYGHFGTDILASVQKYVTVPKRVFCRNNLFAEIKCSSAEMSLSQKVPMPKYPGAEMSLSRKVLVPKSSSAE